jgi:hypothetical protein
MICMPQELDSWEVDLEFARIATYLQAERSAELVESAQKAWQGRPMPIPPGLITFGVTSGHSAFKGHAFGPINDDEPTIRST